jgi:glutaredoxin
MAVFKEIKGIKDNHEIKLFALSTCPWCKKTKKLLDSLQIQYYYIDLDMAGGAEKEEARKEMRKFNPKGSVPTIVVDGGVEVIVGYKEEKIRRALEDE